MCKNLSLFNILITFMLYFSKNELSEALDEKDLRIFRELIKSSLNYNYDLNTQYGPEVGYKTILHLALEEEDGFPFVEELLLVTPCV